MAPKRSQRDPFEVKLSPQKEQDLIQFLAREIDWAIQARYAIVGDDGKLDDAHIKYEGGDPELTKDTPWEGAANLGSWIITESVDAMRARIMATIFTDPIWIVEGYGTAADRAPVIEDFIQWKADQTKLQTYMGRAVHNSLIEGTGVLEVSDRVVLRKKKQRMAAALQQDPTNGLAALDPNGMPTFVRDEFGRFVPAQPGDPHAVVIADNVVRVSAGPTYRVLTLKDFYVLPGHAAEREDIWGFSKRVYRRLFELKCRERDGYYKNVDALGGPASSERLSGTGGVSDVPERARMGQDIAPQQDETTAEKELWEVTCLLDLDDDGYEEWYVITFSNMYRTILRIQYENYDTPSYIILTPFPRPNSVYGFSYAKDKLGSLYDEHTALRNMFADRMALKTSAPILQIEGSPWNPADREFGPGQVIPVRDPNEIKQLEIADVPSSVNAAIQEVIAAKERLSGMNDTTTGQLADANRTLGEVKLVTQQSWIRIDEVVKNLQQGFEDLFDILLIIWKNKLRDDPEPWPGDLLAAMKERNINLDASGMITPDVLEGVFRGKPRGSVEASDFSQMRADLTQFVTALVQLGQAVPAIRFGLNSPNAARALMTEFVRYFRFQNRQALIGGFTGQMPPPPPPEPEPPKVNVQVKADAAVDPMAQDILSKVAQTEGAVPVQQPMPGNPPPKPPVGIPGVSNIAPAPSGPGQ